jgi:diaminopimelate decarboxylase
MNDLIRPTLYQAYHQILPIKKSYLTKTIFGDLVGPICESGDFIAKERELPDIKRGDLFAVMSAGAYGFSMSSNYNARPRSAEVMVDGKKAYLIRKRESYQDLIKNCLIKN